MGGKIFGELFEGVQTLHDDAIVISIKIANYDIKYYLIDNESSTDILFNDIFFQLLTNQLKSVSISLVGFTGDSIKVEGEIVLPVTTG